MNPITYRPTCDEPHDVYALGLCDSCAEVEDALLKAIDRMTRMGMGPDEIEHQMRLELI